MKTTFLFCRYSASQPNLVRHCNLQNGNDQTSSSNTAGVSGGCNTVAINELRSNRTRQAAALTVHNQRAASAFASATNLSGK